MQMPLPNGLTVTIEDATDEQFEAFRVSIGLRIKDNGGSEGMKWSHDNRCRAINHALKYGLLRAEIGPQQNENNSQNVPTEKQKSLPEPNEKNPKTIPTGNDLRTESELFGGAQSAPVAEVVIPGAPLISEMITAVKIAAQHHDFSEVPEGITFSISTEGMSEEQVTEALAKYRNDLFAGICPECGVKIVKERQVGRAVYAQCNHRLFQGRART